MEKKRIEWIDGLKGLACIFILLHHFILGFYPAAYSGDLALAHLPNGLDVKFAQSVLGFFATGDFWVDIFCLTSGFVIAYQVFHMTNEKQFQKAVLKRYPRLVLPVFGVCVIVFVMLYFGLFCGDKAGVWTGSEWLSGFYQAPASFYDLFWESFVDIWMVGLKLTFSNAFWMLNQLFAGSFVAYLFAYIGRGKQKGMLYVYILATLICFSINSRLTCFFLGLIACFLIEVYGEFFEKKKKVFVGVGVGLLILGFILGAYPHAVEPTNAYRYLMFKTNRLQYPVFYHTLAAFFLFMGIYFVAPVGKVLSVKPCKFFGNISYAVYLVHIPIMYSLASFEFTKLCVLFQDYNKAGFLTLVLFVIETILIAWLYWQFVERNMGKLINFVVDKIVGKES